MTEHESKKTSSCFLFDKGDMGDLNSCSEKSSDNQLNENKFPSVSQFSPLNENEMKVTKGGHGDSVLSFIDSTIQNVKIDDLGKSTT